MSNILTEWLTANYPEVEPLAFYRELFPLGELDDRDAYTKGKYTGIAVQVNNKKAKRYSITNDLEPLPALLEEDDFLVISPVSYAGKAQTQENSRFLYAVVFDLDGIQVKDGKPEGLINLLYTIEKSKLLPMPTYIVSSGSGLHLYYFLEKPVAMFKNVIAQLKDLRIYLTTFMWRESFTSQWKQPQYEPPTQCFRAVGSITKDGKQRVKAFRTGKRISLEELNSYVPEENRVKQYAYKNTSRMSLEEAKKLYPEWYEKRVVNKQPRGTWVANRRLYEWWKKQLIDGENFYPQFKGIQEGKRYFGIMCLAIYAKKCGVPYEELEKDALAFIPLLDSRTKHKGNNFDAVDIMAALQAYNDTSITCKRETIEAMTDIRIKPQKRNHRKQAEHLKLSRGMQQVYLSMGEMDKVGGKPSTYPAFKEYVEANPQTNSKEIEEALGIETKTVYNNTQKLRKEYAEANKPLEDYPHFILTPQEKIEIALKHNPQASLSQLEAITGLSRNTVIKYRRSL